MQEGIKQAGTQQYARAKALFQEALQLFQDAGDVKGVRRARFNVALTNSWLNEHAAAVEGFEAVRDLARQAGDNDLLANCLSS